jgi:hypothetical protein
VNIRHRRKNPFADGRPFGRPSYLVLLLPEIRDKSQRLGKTKPDTLRITVTQVAFKDPAAFLVETDGPEGTYRLAHATTDATVVVDHDPLQVGIPVNGFPGTNLQARGRLAMLATQRQIRPCNTAFYDADAGPQWIDHTVFDQCAGNLAESAACALLGVGNKHLCFHRQPILK